MATSVRSVVLLHHQYGPYHFARARALAQRLDAQLHLVQLASRENLREWQVHGPAPEVHTLADEALELVPQRRLATLATAMLQRLKPEAVVIAGYAHAAMRAAATWCRRNRAVGILLSDSHHADRRRNPAKEWLKRAWVSRHFDAAFVSGANAAIYARTLGFDASAIWRGYDVVDNRAFAVRAAEARSRSTALLRELGLPNRVFLYVGRFSREKNLHRLLDSMAEYQRRAGSRAWGLLLVGNGPEAEMLRLRVREMRDVVTIGFKQADELPALYAAASALILPSTSEPWGLVVNEAMACGLPVLVSDRAGAALDLVFPGINGYVFDPEQPGGMIDSMLRVSSEEIDLVAMGLASQRIVENFTPETWAAALIDAIESSMDRRARGARDGSFKHTSW